MKKHFYLIIDTETAGNIDKKETLVYDIGVAVIDKTGKIYQHASMVISEVFYEMPDKMNTAYYAEKIPRYVKDIEEKRRYVVTFEYARGLINYLCNKWECKAIIAHNMYFDNHALDYTYRVLTGKSESFLPNLPKWCTLRMARQTVAKQKAYIEWCKKHGFVCQNGRPQTKAETLYRYMTRNPDFVEKHTGIDDINIERQIFAWIIRQHKAMVRTYYNKK